MPSGSVQRCFVQVTNATSTVTELIQSKLQGILERLRYSHDTTKTQVNFLKGTESQSV